MTFDEADRMLNSVTAFLLEMGGAYPYITGRLQENILACLASEQYVMRENNGRIEYFACYFRIKPEDVEGIIERVRPIDIYTGSVMYVAELGNRLGRKGMTEILRRLREKGAGMQGVIWHRAVKGHKIYNFPSQRGLEVQNG